MEEREEESGRVGGGEWRRVMRRVEEREEESEGELRRVEREEWGGGRGMRRRVEREEESKGDGG